MKTLFSLFSRRLAFIFAIAVVPNAYAFQVTLYPASLIYDEKTSEMDQKLGFAENKRIENFEDAQILSDLDIEFHEQYDHPVDDLPLHTWDGKRPSLPFDNVTFRIRTPGVRVFGIGIGDNDFGGSEKLSINGGRAIVLNQLPGHVSNGQARSYYLKIEAGPDEPDIKSVRIIGAFTLRADHVVIQNSESLQKRPEIPDVFPSTDNVVVPRTLSSRSLQMTRIGGAHLTNWLEAARSWGSKKDFPEEVSRFSSEIIPALLDCFQYPDKEPSIAISAEKQREDQDQLWASAMYCLMALGTNASPAITDIAQLLMNRQLKSRQFLVNAVSSLGPETTNLISIALDDLKSESAQTRQQGLLLLFAACPFSETALCWVVDCTSDEAQLVRHTAIYMLVRLKDRFPQAMERLDEMRNPTSGYSDHGYVREVLDMRKESTVAGPRVR